MATKFYFDKNGVTTGPFHFEELAQLNAQGQLGPETRILTNDGECKWTTWGRLTEDSETRISKETSRRKAPADLAVIFCRASAYVFFCMGLCMTFATLSSVPEFLSLFVPLSVTFAGAAALYALGSIVHWLAVIASKLPSNS